MAKGIKYLVFLGALLAIHSGGATGARAQDPEKPHEPSPAVWMMPAQTQAPSWLDLRSHSAIPDVPHIVTTGEKTALLRDQNARTWILDLQTQTTKDVALPKDVQWLALRRDGSILVYDGTQILTAPSADAAATVEGFVPVLGISGKSPRRRRRHARLCRRRGVGHRRSDGEQHAARKIDRFF